MNKGIFFGAIKRSIFKSRMSQSQVDGINLILKTFENYQLPIEYKAYILATAYHESAHTMQPVRETLGKNDAQVVARLDAAYRKGIIKKRYWEQNPHTRQRYYGRGLVQLTHYANYKKAGEKLNIIDLHLNPDLVMVPEISVRILIDGMLEGWFTGKSLERKIHPDLGPGNDKDDFEQARVVVNGRDKAKLIAGIAEAFEYALYEAEEDAEHVGKTEEIKIEELTTGKKPIESTTVIATVGQAAAGIGSIGLAGMNPWVAALLILAIGVLAGWVIRERMRHSREDGI